MKKKGSSQQWLSGYSPLVSFYLKYHQEILGNTPYLTMGVKNKIQRFEAKLIRSGIEPKHYAQIVMTVLKDWAPQHNMKTLPINVFCSKYAMDLYSRTQKELTQLDVNDNSEMLYYELMVGRSFIQANISDGKRVRLSEIVRSLRALLSNEWMDSYSSKSTRECEWEAIEILGEEYGVPGALSYLDIIDKLWLKIHSNSTENSD